MISMGRKGETVKFEDPRRVAIFSGVNLTESQKKEIDDLFLENYGEKIPYTWHRHFTSYTGKFDKNYFPELLFIPECEKFMNLNQNFVTVFENKNILPYMAAATGVKMPQAKFSMAEGIIRDSDGEMITQDELFARLKNSGAGFIKPTVDSCSGRGCQIIDVHDGIDRESGKSIKEIVLSKGENFVIQERIICHESIRKLYAGSVNTFRIMTYRWKDEICHTPSVMRIGQGGGWLDNAHAGGVFIAIDDDGTLHEKAFTEFQDVFTEHPDTHLKFGGYKIGLFPEVLKTAKKCHAALPQLGCINWDFTIDEKGRSTLIEANLRGAGIWLFEMAHGCGIFGEKTPEILRWIRAMKKMTIDQRVFHKYGKI
jgi:hypothetical protein